MIIEIDDLLVSECGVNKSEILDLLAIALYKYKGVHGSLAAAIANKNEIEFYSLLSKNGDIYNYDVDDLIDDMIDDIKSHRILR